jgi:threonine/homoserine/homoserine lactone efflux protein
MFDTATLLAFLAASIVIVLAPGPAQALTIARSISGGKEAGIVTAVGLNVGTIIHALAAALGLSAVLATSAVAFAVVKYIGAAYLIYLGIQAFLSKEQEAAQAASPEANLRQTFTKAVVTGLLNPKVALFFLAFLPQFVDLQRGSAFLQFIILGIILAIIDMVYESILALAAGALSGWLVNNPKASVWRQRIMGVVLIGLGIRLALIVQH